jgi:hypothetical protein
MNEYEETRDVSEPQEKPQKSRKTGIRIGAITVVALGIATAWAVSNATKVEAST